MKKRDLLIAFFALSVTAWAQTVRFDFEKDAAQKAPQGWKCVGEWRVLDDATAWSGKHLLRMVRNPRQFLGYARGFNLCLRPTLRFVDGNLTVRFRAERGRQDQGGGILWRARDSGTYYVARYNPLEENFCFYKVIGGDRTLLAERDGIRLTPGWHTMTIHVRGDRVEGALDAQVLLRARDRTLSGPGAAGLWTKADAVTSFDDFVVRTEP